MCAIHVIPSNPLLIPPHRPCACVWSSMIASTFICFSHSISTWRSSIRSVSTFRSSFIPLSCSKIRFTVPQFPAKRGLICRRLFVHAETSLADLHHILQLAMGWTNSHLHRFVIHGKEYGTAYDGGMGFANDPKRITLADFRFRLRERFVYEYDFNEHWQHDIRVEQIVEADT